MVGFIGKILLGGTLDKILDLVGQHQRKEISKEQFDAKLRETLSGAVADIETAWAKAVADTYREAQQTVRDSFKAKDWFTRNAWAVTIYSQLFYLFWFQWVVPVTDTTLGIEWASTGDQLLHWAYGLIGLCLGGIGLQKENRNKALEIIKGLAKR